MRIVRGRSTTTATPLVRRRVVVKATVRERFKLVRLTRRLRSKTIVRARAVPTATPLVRRRAIVGQTRQERFSLVRHARRRDATVLRAPFASVTPTRVTQRRATAGARLYRLARRPGATIVRAPLAPLVPFVRARVIVKAKADSRLVGRRRGRVRVLRAPLAVPLVLRPRAPLVTKRRVPVARLRRRDPVIVRAPVVLTVATRRAPVIVTHVRRTPLVARARHRHPLILRATPFSTATPLVRKRLSLETQTANRARLVARRRHKSQPFIAGLARLAYLATGPHYTGTFDPSGANGPTMTAPTVADFDAPNPRNPIYLYGSGTYGSGVYGVGGATFPRGAFAPNEGDESSVPEFDPPNPKGAA